VHKSRAPLTLIKKKTQDARFNLSLSLPIPHPSDLVLAAFARRPAWTTIQADPIVTVLEASSGDRPGGKPPKASDDGNTTSEDEGEDGGGGAHPPTLLTPHPAASASLFHWGEYERIDWERVHAGAQAASSYCVRKGLTRKAHLAFNLKKWAAKHAATRPAAAALAAATPETHVLQVDDPEYVEEALADLPEVRDAAPGSGGAWIAKPSLTNRGAGISIIDSPSALAAALATGAPGASEWVVQRYITPPHLLGRRKWHLRLYALAVGALEVWAYGGGALVLRARAPYLTAGGCVAPLTDLDAHLTNTCHGGGCQRKEEARKKGRGGVVGAALRLVAGLWGGGQGGAKAAAAAFAPPADPVTAGLALSLADLPAALVAENGMAPADAAAAAARLAAQASALVGEAFAAVSAELSFFPLPSAWELFGFDFMVDADWNVYLLEANADPDVGASGEALKGLMAGLVEGTLARTADRVAASVAAGGPAPPAVLAPGVWAGGEGEPSASPSA